MSVCVRKEHSHELLRYYHYDRKFIERVQQPGSWYSYNLRYEIDQAENLQRRPCKPQLSWNEDLCKMKIVKSFHDHENVKIFPFVVVKGYNGQIQLYHSMDASSFKKAC